MPLGSLHSRIVEGVAHRVSEAAETICQSDTTTSVAVYRRKRPILLEEDPLPCIVVAPGSDGVPEIRSWFGSDGVAGVSRGYPVTVALFWKSNAIPTALHGIYDPTADTAEDEYADIMTAAKVVMQSVDVRTLEGLTNEIYDSTIAVGAPFEIPGRNSTPYAVCIISVAFHSYETRAA